MIDQLAKRIDETELGYIWRVGQLKDSGVIEMTWGELADVMNKQLREPDEEWSESAYRKKYALIKSAYDEIFSGYQDDRYLKDLRAQKQEIEKEKRKLYDERLDLNRALREEARLETTIERLNESLNNIADTYFPDEVKPPVHYSVGYGNKMIICLSDLHIGQEFDNLSGRYNTDIARERLNNYLAEILKIREDNQCDECIVCLLGDLISGSIHHRISVTNKEDVVDQVKTASLLVARFVNALAEEFCTVSVYSVGGNHSRLEKNAEDALLSERLDDLIPWFISVMIHKRENVTVYSKTFDDTLGIFEIGDKTYFIQHGDYTKLTEGEIGRLILWAKQTPYCILTGHMHFPAMTNISDVLIVQSGSLCGAGDDYTRSKRLTGKASQTVLVTKPDGAIYGMYPINLE